MSHFNVSLIVWAKSQDNVHKPQFLKRKESRNGSNRGPSAYQPRALPLDQSLQGKRRDLHTQFGALSSKLNDPTHLVLLTVYSLLMKTRLVDSHFWQIALLKGTLDDNPFYSYQVIISRFVDSPWVVLQCWGLSESIHRFSVSRVQSYCFCFSIKKVLCLQSFKLLPRFLCFFVSFFSFVSVKEISASSDQELPPPFC